MYRKHGCCHVVEFFFYFQLRVCFFQHLPNLCNIRWTILLSASWWKSPSMQDGPCISGCRTQSCLTLYSGKPPGILNKGCWSFKPCNGSNLGVSDAFLQAFPMWLAKLLLSNLSACKPVHIGVGNTTEWICDHVSVLVADFGQAVMRKLLSMLSCTPGET